MLFYHQRYALFSLFDCWLFIRVHTFPFTLIERVCVLWMKLMEKRKHEKSNQYTGEMWIESSRLKPLKKKNILHKYSKTFKNPFDSLFFWQILDFLPCMQVCAFSTSNATDRQLFLFIQNVWRYCRFIFANSKKKSNTWKKLRKWFFSPLPYHIYLAAHFFQPKCQKMCDGGKEKNIFYCTKNSHFYNPNGEL